MQREKERWDSTNKGREEQGILNHSYKLPKNQNPYKVNGITEWMVGFKKRQITHGFPECCR